jgi:hypothetical protein
MSIFQTNKEIEITTHHLFIIFAISYTYPESSNKSYLISAEE